MTQFNGCISQNLGKYQQFCTGKMVRGNLICHTSSIIKNKVSDKSLKFASQMELLHNATLLHDDVLDNEKMRRDKPSMNNILGNKNSILLGDCMLADVSYEIACLENIEVVKNMSIILKSFGKGEIENFDYYEKVKNKTALFFAYILKSTLLLEGVTDKEQLQCFFEIGLNYGYYFQYVDDVLDYQEDNENNLLNIMNIETKNVVKECIESRYSKCKELLNNVNNASEMLKYMAYIDDKLNYNRVL